MKRLMLLLGIVLLGHLAATAAAAERQVARLDFSIVRSYESLGTYEAPVGELFGGGGGGGTRTMPCVQAASGGSSIQWDVKRLPGTTPLVIPVYQLDNPPVTQDRYAFKGEVGYDDLGEPAYFEMWSEFPDGSRFFARTLAGSGPTMRLQGTSALRPFELPFVSRPGHRPNRLTINLVMASVGRVTLSDAVIAEADPPATQTATDATDVAPTPVPSLSLADMPPGMAVVVRGHFEQQLVETLNARQHHADAYETAVRQFGAGHRSAVQARQALAWCDERIATFRDALARPTPAASSPTDAENAQWPVRLLRRLQTHFTACFLTLIGLSLAAALVMRRLAARGRGQAFVTGVFGLILAGGVLEIFAAGIALGLGLPSAAWVTLLGSAAMMVVVPAMTLPQVRRQYANAELRRMRAMDVPA